MNNFKKLINIVDRLRSRNGCPWDRKQTLRSIRKNIIEEAYETVEAINTNNYELLKEETGDLFLQAIFISQITKEKNKFTIKDVIDEITEKLVRRHPHFFRNIKVKNNAEVLHNWERIKKSEKEDNKDENFILDNIPEILPALLKADKVQSKVERFGFRWDTVKYPIKKLKEEINEFLFEIRQKRVSRKKVEEEFGDILFTLVNIGRFYKVNPEEALNKTIKKFKNRFKYVENRLKQEDKKISSLNIKKLEELWEESKK